MRGEVAISQFHRRKRRAANHFLWAREIANQVAISPSPAALP
jgi:hypothetical protein